MALWNEKDSQWDNVPDADLTFSDYVTKLLRQPSTFARPAFGGPFASTAQPAPVADQTKMEGMFEEYLKGKQQPTSSFKPMETNLSDSEWAAVKQLRDEQGWNNPYDVNNRKAFGQAVMGMLGGPVSFLTGAYRAQEPANTAMGYLNSYMAQKDTPREVASSLGRYPTPSEVPITPETTIYGEPVSVEVNAVPSSSYAQSYYNPTPAQIQTAIQMANQYTPSYTADADGGYTFSSTD